MDRHTNQRSREGFAARAALYAATTALVLAASIALLLSPSASKRPTSPSAPGAAPRTAAPTPTAPPVRVPVVGGGAATTQLPPALSAAALRFAPGYLAYVYGRGSVATIHPAAPRLLARLRQAGRLALAPGWPARVQALRGQQRSPRLWRVSLHAQDTNGTFPLTIDFALTAGRWEAQDTVTTRSSAGG